MKRSFENIEKKIWDIAVIGGGINGAGVLSAANSAGLNAILFEKYDFASGTSSHSTRLIHGGLRYLEHFQFNYVFESLRERQILLKSFPSLVRPLPFVLPVYKNWRRPGWMLKTGVAFYDILAGHKKIKPHRTLTLDRIKKLVPGIETKNLYGGILYYDAVCDVERMIIHLLKNSVKNGAHTINYSPVENMYRDEHSGWKITVRDKFTNNIYNVTSRTVVNASGPWVDLVLKSTLSIKLKKRIRPTRGAHILIPNNGFENALITVSPVDERIFFVIPLGEMLLVGTTDDDENDDPALLTVKKREIDYLVNGFNRYFPGTNLTASNIIKSFVGVRPLINIPGTPPDKVPRRHKIIHHDKENLPGLYSLTGGKLTTFRLLAEETINRLLAEQFDRKKKYVFELPGYNETGYDDEKNIEIAVREEMAVTIEDVLRRRMKTPFKCVMNKQLIKKTADTISEIIVPPPGL